MRRLSRQCGYSGDDGQGVLSIPLDLRCDVIAVRGRAGKTVESVPQHCQPLALRALFFLKGCDLAFCLPVRNLAIHGIDCLACLGHCVAVLAVVNLADGFAQVDANAGCRAGIKGDGQYHGKGRGRRDLAQQPDPCVAVDVDRLLERSLRPPVILRSSRYSRVEAENNVVVELYADVTASPPLLDDRELLVGEREHQRGVERLALPRHHRAFSGPAAQPVRAGHAQPGPATQGNWHAASDCVARIYGHGARQPVKSRAAHDRVGLADRDRQLTAAAERKDLHQNSMAHRTVKDRAER